MQQVREWDVIHDEVALFLVHFQEEGVILDDVSVVKMLDVCEIAFQEEDVLAVQTNAFHCIQFPTLLQVAFLHNTMCTLSDLFAHYVLLLENRACLLRGLTLIPLKIGLRRLCATKRCTLLELINMF